MNINLRCGSIILVIAFGWRAICSAGLEGRYLFEEGSGTTAFDSSGNARHGTHSNDPAYVPGLYPGSAFALQLNSAGPNTPNTAAAQSVVLPANTDFIRNSPGATLTAWVRLDGGSNDRTILAINDGGTGEGQPRAALDVSIFPFTGEPHFIIRGRQDNSGGLNGLFASTPAVVGETYFVAGVLDYANGSNAIYINGVLSNFGVVLPWDGSSADTPNKFAEIGSLASPSVLAQHYWPGVIDGVHIFDRALSADEILNLYQNPDSVPEPTHFALFATATMYVRALRVRR